MLLFFVRILLDCGSLGHILEHIRLWCLHSTRCLSVLSRSLGDVRLDVGITVVVVFFFLVVVINITVLFILWLRDS
jgi:hypothetical protein